MIRDNRDDGLQSLRLVFAALTLFLGVDLPSNFEDIKTVNVYEANGDEGDDWKTLLNDQGQAWIITPLHYTKGGSRIIRKASGGGTWNQKEKNHENASYCVRTYNFVENKNKKQATNEGMGLPKYTMIEYTRPEDKPKYALCRITVDNKKSAHDRPPSSSQQPKRMPKHALCQITVDNENYAHDRPPSSSQQQKNMEIDQTERNNGDKCETSLSQESTQQGGQNATGYDNESKLKEFEQNIQDPYNFNANLTEPTENGWYLPYYYAPTVPPITDQGTYNAIEEQEFALCNTQHGQEFEQNLQDPYNFNANLTDPMENGCYYAPTLPLITDQGPYNAIAEQEFALCNTQHGQMFQPEMEPMEMSDHLPIHDHNIIAPAGPSTSN
ncbi:hypothetical protein FCM35_KLT16581 [Carex littledalei]|uniref:NAC domain-containing protein n=1 Tax=Carex littledalei TaxID=544730 RepID=A0A833QZD0_9POAL|nr:hypothetical protein FCM35_KLT16581 [Carex littledalei]